MEILFKSIEDVKEHIGWLYASSNFPALRTDLELASEDVAALVGEEVYARAVKYYNSTDVILDVDKELIRMFQLPIALLAYLSYAENGDISHETDGRKVKIDRDSETMPWEWQIERDDAAILKKANKTIDRLIDFLDKNIDRLPEWKNSEQRKDMLSLFIRSAKQFDEIVPIDHSRQFFIRVLPFVRQEDRELIAFLGRTRYDALKEAMAGEVITGEQEEIIRLCQEIIPHKVMAKAVRRFAVKVLPDSVVTKFYSERQTMKATTPASAEQVRAAEMFFQADAIKAVTRLQEYLRKLNPRPDRKQDREETDYTKEKFFTV